MPTQSHQTVYRVTIDGAKHEFANALVTGAQLKAIAHIDPASQLFLEEHGERPDHPINDGETVDLSLPGREHFYSAPPATYGLDQGDAL